jgi:hypothetical protein
LELDLKKLGVKHSNAYPDVFTDAGGIIDLFFAGRRMPLARYPNDGFMTMQRVLKNGGPGKHDGGVFQYRGEDQTHFQAWEKDLDRGVWLKGYWRVVWQNEALRLKSIDTTNRIATFALPVPGGIGNKYHRPEGNGQEEYWLLNLLEEVDQPGEWCIDFKNQKLYFYPPAPLGSAEMLLADGDGPIIQLAGASRVVLRGLTLDGSLNEGITVKGGEEDLIAGCIVHNVDKYAIVVNGGKNHIVQSCDLYDLGAGGVWLGGGDEISTPRVPAGHKVINNHIHDFSQIERVYTPGVNCGFTGGGGGGHHPAVGMLVAHNLIHDTPHGAVLFGSWDSVFEYNEAFRYCTVSNDLGAFYCYDTYKLDGNQTIRYNLMHDTEDGDGIYFDNDHRDMHIYGNIAALKSVPNRRGTGFLYKIGSQAKNPQSIDCYNNIAIDCNVGFQFVSALTNQGKIENNVAVTCKPPWIWKAVRDGKQIAVASDFASGKNVVYDADPGFVDISRLDFRLKPGNRIQQDLPGFLPIPWEKIGLYVDEYRTSLPTDDEIDRFGKRTTRSPRGYDVEDRK